MGSLVQRKYLIQVPNRDLKVCLRVEGHRIATTYQGPCRFKPRLPTSIMDLLYLSRCVPSLSENGENVRAYEQLRSLALNHRVHLACFARDAEDSENARNLHQWCSSVHVEPLPKVRALAEAAIGFTFGGSLTISFYESSGMRQHVRSMSSRVPLDATVVSSSAMAQYALAELPVLFDMIDVDSEKWLLYSQFRKPAFAYALESRRLRNQERKFAEQAECTIVSTAQEENILRKIAPRAYTVSVENGVDCAYFNPCEVEPPPGLKNRMVVLFTGVMDHPPNSQAAIWFARQVLPMLLSIETAVEFFIVGAQPSRAVQELSQLPGVTVTGEVPDVRPYMAASRVVVAPLKTARGLHNRVPEALAMGKHVVGSRELGRSFGAVLPTGLTCCESVPEFAMAILPECRQPARWHPVIRSAAQRRFCWDKCLLPIEEQLAKLGHYRL
jgi:sugar transferase (PEP-CTERM/EpsH1 system associated)